MTTTPVRRVRYTAILGGYESLAEVAESAQDHLVDNVCFTDNTALRSDTWRIVLIEPRFTNDAVRSARYLKIIGHPYLDQYDETLWTDNRVMLMQRPSDFMDMNLKSSPLALFTHSYRKSVADEFRSVLHSQLDGRERVRAQYRAYQQSMPEVLHERPYWTAIMARKRHVTAVTDFGSAWRDEVLIHSRRDQLSVNYAMRLTGLAPLRINLDNLRSNVHTWQTQGEVARRSVPAWRSGTELANLLGDELDRSKIGRRVTAALDRAGIYERLM